MVLPFPTRLFSLVMFLAVCESDGKANNGKLSEFTGHLRREVWLGPSRGLKEPNRFRHSARDAASTRRLDDARI